MIDERARRMARAAADRAAEALLRVTVLEMSFRALRPVKNSPEPDEPAGYGFCDGTTEH